jgi:uncharacterized damage-inducible protein DinB
MREILNLMNRYNRWMNGNLLEACSALSDAERKADRGAPFRSIHGIWNHLLLCDRAWLLRFRGEPVPYTSLDQELCTDWEELKLERATTDDAIDSWVAGLSDETLAGELRFTPMSNPTPMVMPMRIVALHLFNHQTHHRGQITALLEQAGGDCGVTDLARMPLLSIRP